MDRKILLVLLCFVISVSLINDVSALDGWTYKAPITVSVPSGSTEQNYQVLLTIDTATLYDAGKLQANCSDLRFVDSTEAVELDYWINGTCNTTGSTYVFVQVDQNITTSGYTFYMYYGNSSVSTTSNGTNTMEFYDDFTGVMNVSAALWTPTFSNGVVNVTNGMAWLYGNGNSCTAVMTAKTNFSGNVSIYYYTKNTQTYEDNHAEMCFMASNLNCYDLNNGYNIEQGWVAGASNPNAIRYYWDDNGFYSRDEKREQVTSSEHYTRVTSFKYDSTTWNRTIYYKNTTVGAGWKQLDSYYNTTVLSYFKFSSNYYDTGTNDYNYMYDDVFVTKYHYPEPVYSFGGESLIETIEVTAQEPQNISYEEGNINFNATTNATAVAICLSVDGNLTYPLCSYGISQYSGFVASVDAGFYNWTFRANNTYGHYDWATVYFTVEPPDTIQVTINEPLNTSYVEGNVDFNATTNATAVAICLSVDGNLTFPICAYNVSELGGFAPSMTAGFYNWTFRANNTDENYDWETIYFTVIEPTLVIEIVSPENMTYSTATIDLEVLANYTVDAWWYTLNSGSNITFTPNITITAIEGLNNITVYANDTLGNVGYQTVYFTFTVAPAPANPVRLQIQGLITLLISLILLMSAAAYGINEMMKDKPSIETMLKVVLFILIMIYITSAAYISTFTW